MVRDRKLISYLNFVYRIGLYCQFAANGTVVFAIALLYLQHIIIYADTGTKSIRLRGKIQHLEEAKKQINDFLQKEKEFVCSPEYIRQKKGVKEYLMYLGDVQEVQYPSYWKQQPSHCVQEPLDCQSELYKEVEKMIHDTWEASKAGHGNDASGLKHTKLVVKQIFLVQNWGVFKMYSAMRKQVCMEAAVSQFPSLNGLQGEWQVKTRTLGMPTFFAVPPVSSINDHIQFIQCIHFSTLVVQVKQLIRYEPGECHVYLNNNLSTM